MKTNLVNPKPATSHRSYNEACHDPTATPIERENALLTEQVHLLRQLEWLWSKCTIVYCPPDGSYPVEHNPHAAKYARDIIEAKIPSER